MSVLKSFLGKLSKSLYFILKFIIMRMLNSGGVVMESVPGANFYVQIIPIVLLVVVFYFFLIRPQKKRDKAEKEMRSSIEVGDNICTIGGIVGKVMSMKDDTLIIETSAERNKMEIYRWAIRNKIVPNEANTSDKA